MAASRSRMGTVLCVHGTGIRDVEPILAQVRAGVARHLGWPADRVHAVDWGNEVGPADLDVRPALPPEDAVGEAAAQGWELLLADPPAEVRLLAGGAPAAVNGSARVAEVAERLRSLPVDDPGAAAAGVSSEELASAAAEVASDPAFAQAAQAPGRAADAALLQAAARAVVATALGDRLVAAAGDAGALPAAAHDADARDRLVAHVAEAVSPPSAPASAGAPDSGSIAHLVTHLLVARRAALMDPVSDFIRDVAFYLRRGDAVRAVVAREVRRHRGGGPLVLLAHSLGGVAAVDVLSDPDVMEGDDPLDVALLVTVGSQAPLLHLLDALHALSPCTPGVTPFEPWLNVYDRQDLLAFCAGRVWPGAAGIADAEIVQRVPFPLSHTAYFAQDRLYALVGDHLPG